MRTRVKLTDVKAWVHLLCSVVDFVKSSAIPELGSGLVEPESTVGRISCLVHQVLEPALLAHAFDVSQNVLGLFENVIALACPSSRRCVFKNQATSQTAGSAHWRMIRRDATAWAGMSTY